MMTGSSRDCSEVNLADGFILRRTNRKTTALARRILFDLPSDDHSAENRPSRDMAPRFRLSFGIIA